MSKKRVFITGATGNMGGAAFQELLRRSDRFDIVLLARPSNKNIKKLRLYQNHPAVRIIWGDLTDYDAVLKGVTGADFVLHIGGMVSPAADMYPERTLKVNIQGAQNVVRAIKAQPDPDS
ncbi:MAG TPA: NAD-dependent epimerase/dehydratase family protein, partial [Candidatus Coprenecus merdipullorum]|nr:NAD-dependent epimerase/dehydratase family protein [Candidatus Coprenecus merdipullorum]